jgi:hypothetical protein
MVTFCPMLMLQLFLTKSVQILGIFGQIKDFFLLNKAESED